MPRLMGGVADDPVRVTIVSNNFGDTTADCSPECPSSGTPTKPGKAQQLAEVQATAVTDDLAEVTRA